MVRVYCIAVILLLSMTTACRSETISGKEAAAYIGDLSQRLTAQQHYAIVLERRDPDPVTNDRIDAVVFNASGGTYHPIRRLNGDYRLILNAPDGSAATLVAQKNISLYEKMIADNDLTASVVRDAAGSELFIVYCGLKPCYIEWNKRRDGSIVLGIHRRFVPHDETPDIIHRSLSEK